MDILSLCCAVCEAVDPNDISLAGYEVKFKAFGISEQFDSHGRVRIMLEELLGYSFEGALSVMASSAQDTVVQYAEVGSFLVEEM